MLNPTDLSPDPLHVAQPNNGGDAGLTTTRLRRAATAATSAPAPATVPKLPPIPSAPMTSPAVSPVRPTSAPQLATPDIFDNQRANLKAAAAIATPKPVPATPAMAPPAAANVNTQQTGTVVPPPSLPPALPPALPASTMTPPTAPNIHTTQLPTPGAPAATATPAGPVTGHIANVAPINPEADLRSTLITPAEDPVLDTARQTMADASTGLATFDRDKTLTDLMAQFKPTGAAKVPELAPADDIRAQLIRTDDDARTAGLANQTDTQAAKLANVDRLALAKEELADFVREIDPEYALKNRLATQRAAVGGRLGSGMLRTDFGNLDLARSRDITSKGSALLRDALEGTIGDQFDKTAAMSSLESVARAAGDRKTDDLRGERAAQNSLTDRSRDQFNTDRNFAAGVTEGTAGDRARALEGAGAVFGTLNNEAASRRNELRDERGFQVGQENAAFERQLGQHLAEQNISRDAFDRAMRMIQMGESGNPSDVLAQLASGGVDMQTIALLAQALGQNGGGGGGGGGINLPPINLPGFPSNTGGGAIANDPILPAGVA